MTEEERELDLQLAEAVDEIKALKAAMQKAITLRSAAQAGMAALYDMVEDGDSTDKCQAMIAITQLQAALEKS